MSDTPSKVSKQEQSRWFIAAASEVAAFFGTLYFSLFFLLFGAFPKELAQSTGGFLTGFFLVFTGSFLAPRNRFAIAIVLFVLGSALASSFFPPKAALSGAIAALAFIGWWFHPRRTRRSILWVSVAAVAAICGFAWLVRTRYVDRDAKPQALSPYLERVLGTNATMITAFYEDDLGGFIDHEWLWRIDAPANAISLVIDGFELKPANEPPPNFWRMPPHYWPRRMPPGSEAFQSAGFLTDGRGNDGWHCLLLHDKAQDRAFVWVKNNF